MTVSAFKKNLLTGNKFTSLLLLTFLSTICTVYITVILFYVSEPFPEHVPHGFSTVEVNTIPLKINKREIVRILDAQVGHIASTIDSTEPKFKEFHESSVIRYDGINDLMAMKADYWVKKELLCPVEGKRNNASIPDLPVTIIITFNCQELFNFPRWGTASFIHLFYAIRLEAYLDKNIALYILCDDANDKKKELIHPWMMGYFPPSNNIHSGALSTPLVCHNRHSLALIYDEIQYDLRRMAVALVGVSHSKSISDLAEKQFWSKNPSKAANAVHALPTPKNDDKPLLASANIVLDDAVIHFRCGDLMDSTHPRYSVMSFHDYARFISAEAASIGILTQPFDCADNRQLDSKQVLCDRCRIVVMSLVDYIQKKFQRANVSIRNDKQETTALTYARMIMANETVVGISGFSAFAALATFGTSYIPVPKSGSANYIVNYEPSTLLPKNVVRFYDAKIIMVADLKKLWESVDGTERVLDWFWNDSNADAGIVI